MGKCMHAWMHGHGLVDAWIRHGWMGKTTANSRTGGGFRLVVKGWDLGLAFRLLKVRVEIQVWGWGQVLGLE